jgi:hypothetical protein
MDSIDIGIYVILGGFATYLIWALIEADREATRHEED